MDRYKRLENVANGIYAAGKIRNIYNSNLHINSSAEVRADNISRFGEALQIIAEYSPERYSKVLQEAFHNSSTHYKTYKDLKYHIHDVRNNGITADAVIKALGTLKPILGNRSQTAIDKILRIHEILST